VRSDRIPKRDRQLRTEAKVRIEQKRLKKAFSEHLVEEKGEKTSRSLTTGGRKKGTSLNRFGVASGKRESKTEKHRAVHKAKAKSRHAAQVEGGLRGGGPSGFTQGRIRGLLSGYSGKRQERSKKEKRKVEFPNWGQERVLRPGKYRGEIRKKKSEWGVP